jgi:hypothetical protein
LQVEKLVAPGNHFEQGEQAQRRRIAVDARRFRQMDFRSWFQSWFWIIALFPFIDTNIVFSFLY